MIKGSKKELLFEMTSVLFCPIRMAKIKSVWVNPRGYHRNFYYAYPGIVSFNWQYEM